MAKRKKLTPAVRSLIFDEDSVEIKIDGYKPLHDAVCNYGEDVATFFQIFRDADGSFAIVKLWSATHAGVNFEVAPFEIDYLGANLFDALDEINEFFVICGDELGAGFADNPNGVVERIIRGFNIPSVDKDKAVKSWIAARVASELKKTG